MKGLSKTAGADDDVPALVTFQKPDEYFADPELQLETAGQNPAEQARLLKVMLAEQQQALRRSIQAAIESEKAAEHANAKLVETQDQLRACEKELTNERLEMRSASNSAACAAAELKNQLSAAERSLLKADRMHELDRRLIFRVGPGLVLAAIIAFLLVNYRPAPLQAPARSPGPVPPKVERNLPNQDEGARALERLDRALEAFPAASVPRVLAEANRRLAASGSMPCSIEWADGQHAVVVGTSARVSHPLGNALTRCAEALERLR